MRHYTDLKRSLQPVLKTIGIGLFVWLLSRIDRDMLLQEFRNLHMIPFIASFVPLLLSYWLKVIRWEYLIRLSGKPADLRYAWETYNIGTFLGMITPGKVGEFGRVGYLRTHGIPAGIATVLVVADRLFDVAIIGLFSLVAAGILFGAEWFAIGILCLLITVPASLWLAWHSRKVQTQREWFRFVISLSAHLRLLVGLLLLTTSSWITYCVWAVFLGMSIGMTMPVLSLSAAVIFVGVIALLPIAPAGLGTRDASLIWLLQPFGVSAPEAVALSSLMFIAIVTSSLIGAWYWAKGVSAPRGNR